MPQITVGVPVYQGVEFIADSLRSIQNQTYPNFKVIISLDGNQPESEERIQPFLRDPRFQLSVRPQRVGWVENLNWLMRQVETPYFCFHAQDDLLDKSYLKSLLEYAINNRESAVVYGDIVTFGNRQEKIVQFSVVGGAVYRQFTLLHFHHAAVALRGLTRREALHLAGNIRSNAIEGFSSDTVWMAAMAKWGKLTRIPVEIYYKRYHDRNEHTRWQDWTQEKIAHAWMLHCADMLEQALEMSTTPRDNHLLWLAAVLRLISADRFGYGSNVKQNDQQLNIFIEYLQKTARLNLPGRLEKTWEQIHDQTDKFLNAGTTAILKKVFHVEYRLRLIFEHLKFF